MNTIMKSLIVAEEIADRHGDLTLFREQYERLRERAGITDAIKAALSAQDLYEIFEGRG